MCSVVRKKAISQKYIKKYDGGKQVTYDIHAESFAIHEVKRIKTVLFSILVNLVLIAIVLCSVFTITEHELQMESSGTFY